MYYLGFSLENTFSFILFFYKVEYFPWKFYIILILEA